jgi:integrase/recombinase XerD
MKVNRNGKARSLSPAELDQLLEAAPSPRYRCLWSLQRWSAARISEALQLTWADLNGAVTYRRATTKTKATRQVQLTARLAEEIAAYRLAWQEEHGHAPGPAEALFPAFGSTTQPMSRQAADKALRAVSVRLGFEGVSTHSFRRSFATGALRRGIDLPTIQAITGHKSLGSLGHYLDADEAAVASALEGA